MELGRTGTAELRKASNGEKDRDGVEAGQTLKPPPTGGTGQAERRTGSGSNGGQGPGLLGGAGGEHGADGRDVPAGAASVHLDAWGARCPQGDELMQKAYRRLGPLTRAFARQSPFSGQP